MAILTDYPDGWGSVMTISGAQTLTFDADGTNTLITGRVIFCDPAGGAINLDFDVDWKGVFVVINTADAAEAITVRDSGDATIAVCDQSQNAIIFGDGAGNYAALVAANT